ncbi:thioredoxin domain-containing protein 6 isoform X3 [Pleurodeles waltl]|uniref:thioredoxin domain-containing protein 6 isoform X3 n=2 Tax=Pleurodeles waltl TaxID=8319 RepID=UPI0037094612
MSLDITKGIGILWQSRHIRLTRHQTRLPYILDGPDDFFHPSAKKKKKNRHTHSILRILEVCCEVTNARQRKMAAKKKEVTLQVSISNQEQWEEVLSSRGLIVVDAYQAWCGPCKTVVSLFRKIKNELGDDLLQFAVAEADGIDSLEKYRGKCEPTFLFYGGGELVAVVRGAVAPLLQKTILEQLTAEKKVLDQSAERKVVKDDVLFNEVEENAAAQLQIEVDDLVPPGKSCTVAIIKPDAVAHGKADEIIMKIQEAGFEILANEQRTMTESEARDFYHHRAGDEKFEELVQFMASGPCRVLIISKPSKEEDEDVIPAWREFIGPTDVEVAKKEKPESLRAQYGTEVMFNAVHGSEDREQASRELAFFFPHFKAPDMATQNTRTMHPERTLALIRPEILKERKDEVLQSIQEAGFSIAMQKEVLLTEQHVREFYKEHIDEDYFPALLQQMTSGPVLALALVKEKAVDHWRELLGPADISQAIAEAPVSFRAKFPPKDSPVNQLHGSSSKEEAEKELSFFFPVEQTLATIKPDALEGHRDEIMEEIKGAGFVISQIKETCLDREMAEEFYKEHKGKPFFEQLVDYMCQGPSLMMILSKENAVNEWRALMGPTDPEVAQSTAPGSLRSKFAKSILQNGLHGASNEEHAVEKIKFVFGDIDLERVDVIDTGINQERVNNQEHESVARDVSEHTPKDQESDLVDTDKNEMEAPAGVTPQEEKDYLSDHEPKDQEGDLTDGEKKEAEALDSATPVEEKGYLSEHEPKNEEGDLTDAEEKEAEALDSATPVEEKDSLPVDESQDKADDMANAEQKEADAPGSSTPVEEKGNSFSPLKPVFFGGHVTSAEAPDIDQNEDEAPESDSAQEEKEHSEEGQAATEEKNEDS